MLYTRKFLSKLHIEDEIVGAVRQKEAPRLGQIIAWRDEETLKAQAWRLIDIIPFEEEGYSRMRFRHPEADPNPNDSGGGDDLFLRWYFKSRSEREKEESEDSQGSERGTAEETVAPPKFTQLSTQGQGILILPEDYPVGSTSGGLLPTAETLWEKVRNADREEESRFSHSGFCSSCGRPITTEEDYKVFENNLVVEGGPPVAFHRLRSNCWGVGQKYEKAYQEHLSSEGNSGPLDAQ